MSAQPEEAVELYLAADRPVAALALINGQLSAAIAAAAEEESGAQPALGENRAHRSNLHACTHWCPYACVLLAPLTHAAASALPP